jgi:hypothetical protein
MAMADKIPPSSFSERLQWETKKRWDSRIPADSDKPSPSFYPCSPSKMRLGRMMKGKMMGADGGL